MGVNIRYDQLLKLTSDINVLCDSSKTWEYMLRIEATKFHTVCNFLNNSSCRIKYLVKLNTSKLVATL